jgi:hypothetical protein
MNRDPAFLEEKLTRIHDPHISPLNRLVGAWHMQGCRFPGRTPTLQAYTAGSCSCTNHPGPAASARHGISPDNNDQTAARFWRLSRDAGPARTPRSTGTSRPGMFGLPAPTSTRVPRTARPRCLSASVRLAAHRPAGRPPHGRLCRALVATLPAPRRQPCSRAHRRTTSQRQHPAQAPRLRARNLDRHGQGPPGGPVDCSRKKRHTRHPRTISSHHTRLFVRGGRLVDDALPR